MEPSSKKISSVRSQRGHVVDWLVGLVAVGVGLLVGIIIPVNVCTMGSSPRFAARTADSANLCIIGQAMLTAETNHPGTLTSGDLPDVYALAARLARDDALTAPSLWFSKIDRDAAPGKLPDSIFSPASAAATAPINPKFQGAPLAFAVALFPPGTHLKDLPPTTPLIWTRGLQPEGEWRSDGPYGETGGLVFFANGTVISFKAIEDKLAQWGSSRPTSNIVEALPPGTRISEFTPAGAKPR